MMPPVSTADRWTWAYIDYLRAQRDAGRAPKDRAVQEAAALAWARWQATLATRAHAAE